MQPKNNSFTVAGDLPRGCMPKRAIAGMIERNLSPTPDQEKHFADCETCGSYYRQVRDEFTPAA